MLADAHRFITAFTEIPFIPIWLADVWRISLWFAIFWLILRYIKIAPEVYRTWRKASLYGTGALAVFMLGGSAETAQRIHQPAVLEITPVLTLGVILAHLSLRELERETPSGSVRRR